MGYGKIGVILGGPSAEREISLTSGRAIYKALKKKGHEVIKIGEDNAIEDTILTSSIDIAFIALHGRYGEDGTIQKFLEEVKIPYTGSGPFASKQALDKAIAKSLMLDNDIPTADYAVVDTAKPGPVDFIKGITDKFAFPVVIKPIDEGSSIGLNIVAKKEQLREAIEEATQYNPRFLVEKYISGRELTVGILGQAALPVVEIAPKGGHYSFHAKYTKGMSDYLVPAKLPADVYRDVQLFSLKAHRVLGCQGLSRVDLRLDEQNQPWILEVNTIPGFTPTSLLPKAAQAVGVGFGDLCERILDLAMQRKMAEISH